MKTGIILYQSKYGSTKKYAEWLREETGFDCIDTKKAEIQTVLEYDTIILGGGIYASGIAGLSFIRKNLTVLKNKKIAVFCVGASPYEENSFNQIIDHNYKNDIAGIPCFYCRGGWNEEEMSFKDRTLCKLLQKAVSRKAPEDYEIWEKALMCAVGQKCDWTDKEYLKPLLEFAKK
ncbi:flavodoxin domain-containing protein [Lachnospiraceae bacterium OttesenSCG-928-J05]|nr:flavodoxin domain-containing protein [Lachnospiraceae bacterium OttesenSCG-928-J05]